MAQQPGVRRRVGRPQPQVRRQRVTGRHLLAVGQVHLVGVAGPELLLDLGEGVAVPARGAALSRHRSRPAWRAGRTRGRRTARPGCASRSRRGRSPTDGPGGPGGRRSRSSRPSARPDRPRHARSPARARRRRPRRRPPTAPPWWRVTSRRAASKLSETSSSSSTPTSDRRPDQSRAPPPSSQKTLSLRANPSRTASRTGSLMPCSLMRGPVLRERPDELRAVARQDRLGVELDALEREAAVTHRHHHPVGGRGHLEHVGDRGGGERVVAHRLEGRGDPAEHTDPLVGHAGHLAVGRLDPLDRAAVRRDQGLHAEAHAEDRHAELEHPPAEGEVGRIERVTGTG